MPTTPAHSDNDRAQQQRRPRSANDVIDLFRPVADRAARDIVQNAIDNLGDTPRQP
jgi:hypothetical protein